MLRVGASGAILTRVTRTLIDVDVAVAAKYVQNGTFRYSTLGGIGNQI